MKENNKGAKKMIASERYETILNLIQELDVPIKKSAGIRCFSITFHLLMISF